MTYPLLKNAPDHDSPEFIQYLKKNNFIVFEDRYILGIRNCKYWTEENDWLTFFAKEAGDLVAPAIISFLSEHYLNYEWLKKSSERQTVKRFHIHIYQTDPKTGEDKQR